jgi:hypothetical protein
MVVAGTQSRHTPRIAHGFIVVIGFGRSMFRFGRTLFVHSELYVAWSEDLTLSTTGVHFRWELAADFVHITGQSALYMETIQKSVSVNKKQTTPATFEGPKRPVIPIASKEKV